MREYYKSVYHVPPSASVLRFLEHELLQKLWLALLDDRFMDACKNGIVVMCGDGIKRRIFPWIAAYLADYPEK